MKRFYSVSCCCYWRPRMARAVGRLLRVRGQLHESEPDDDIRVEGHLRVAVRFEDRSADARRARCRDHQSRRTSGRIRTAGFSTRRIGRTARRATRERICDRSPHRHAEAAQQGERQGDRANQVVLDPTGKVAATVTYNSGTFSVFGVEPDGSSPRRSTPNSMPASRSARSSRGPARTASSFRRTAVVYVAELGLDRVYMYRVDPAKRTVDARRAAVRDDEHRRLGAAAAAAASERKVPLRQSRDRFEGERLRGGRRAA